MKPIFIVLLMCMPLWLNAQRYGVKWFDSYPNHRMSGVSQYNGTIFTLRENQNYVQEIVKLNPCLQADSAYSCYFEGILFDFKAVGENLIRLGGDYSPSCPEDSADCFAPDYLRIHHLRLTNQGQVDFDSLTPNGLFIGPDDPVFNQNFWAAINVESPYWLQIGDYDGSFRISKPISNIDLFYQRIQSVGTYQDSLVRLTASVVNDGYWVVDSDTILLKANKANHILLRQNGSLVDVLQTSIPDSLQLVLQQPIFDNHLNMFLVHKSDSLRLSKFDRQGQLVWKKNFGVNGNGSVTHNSTGHLLFIHEIPFELNILKPKYFLLTDSGHEVWQSEVVNSFTFDYPQTRLLGKTARVELTEDNRVFICGDYRTNLSLMGRNLPPSPGSYSGFVAEIGLIQPLHAFTTRNRYCITDSVQLVFDTLSHAQAGNEYIIEMSDGAGSFTSAIQVATGQNSPLQFAFPSNIPQGANYQFRVRSTNPAQTGEPTQGCITLSFPPVQPQVTPADTLHLCLPGEVVLRAEADGPIVWNNGATSDSIIVASAGGTFFVTAISGACSVSSNHVVVNTTNRPTIPTFSKDTTFCLLGGATSYQLPFEHLGGSWSGSGVSGFTFDFQNLSAGAGFLIYHIGDEDCSDSDTLRYRILAPGEENCLPTSNRSGLISGRILAYPNPGKGTVVLEIPLGADSDFQLFDAQGRAIFDFDLDKLKSNMLEFNSLPAGIYLFKMKGFLPVRFAVEK